LVRIPVGYFLSRKLKKYHSFSPIFAFSATTNTAPPNLDISTAPDQCSTAARITKRKQLLDLQYYSYITEEEKVNIDDDLMSNGSVETQSTC
jgi:hypothetical protein